MRNRLLFLLALFSLLFIISCNNNDYRRTENGTLMKFYTM